MTLRHFVLSLAAVFTALAVGVVVGARVLSDPMVADLRDEKGDLQQQIRSLTDQKAALNQRITAADEFDTQMSGRIVADALAGKSVVLFRTPDADDGDIDALTRLVGQAGGSVTATIGLTAEFVDANAAEKLRSVVNSPVVPVGSALDTALLDPSAQAGDLLGIALLINRDPAIAPVGDPDRDTVLSALRDTGFLAYDGHPGPADTALVVSGGVLPADAGNRGSTVARFAAALAPHGAGTVLAGRDAADGADGAGSSPSVSAVAVTRADPGLSAAVSTVDDIGIPAGRITAVLALQAMLAGAPPQHYGIGPGATALTVTPR